MALLAMLLFTVNVFAMWKCCCIPVHGIQPHEEYCYHHAVHTSGSDHACLCKKKPAVIIFQDKEVSHTRLVHPGSNTLKKTFFLPAAICNSIGGIYSILTGGCYYKPASSTAKVPVLLQQLRI